MTATGPLLSGLGIHGQYLFVDAERQLVIAKVSSHDLPELSLNFGDGLRDQAAAWA